MTVATFPLARNIINWSIWKFIPKQQHLPELPMPQQILFFHYIIINIILIFKYELRKKLQILNLAKSRPKIVIDSQFRNNNNKKKTVFLKLRCEFSWWLIDWLIDWRIIRFFLWKNKCRSGHETDIVVPRMGNYNYHHYHHHHNNNNKLLNMNHIKFNCWFLRFEFELIYITILWNFGI